ncbi:MAG: hypothetical protein ABIR79_11900 [Candidatus Binatia bacterium]
MERRLIILLLVLLAMIVVLAPRIDLWFSADACLARRGHWDAADRRCDVPTVRRNSH